MCSSDLIYHHRIEYPSTKEISAGKGRFIPVPKQGTITLEIMNPLRGPPLPGTVPPPVSEAKPSFPGEDPSVRRVDES